MMETISSDTHERLSDRDITEALSAASERLMTLDRISAEDTYADAIRIDPAQSSESLTNEEVVERFETDHAVKIAPTFRELLEDENRTMIISVRERAVRDGVFEIMEHDALVELDDYLQTAEKTEYPYSYEEDPRDIAKDMRENLTFIGENEYNEAVLGIAAYWKNYLSADPNRQIYVATGYLKAENGKPKSDQYLLEKILEVFDEEDLNRFAGRLITDPEYISAAKVSDLKTVLLDDWTISGRQLLTTATQFAEAYPDYASTIEIQLITATEKRIKEGFEEDRIEDTIEGQHAERTKISLPVRAYYVAHDSRHTDKFGGARITGAHSSVDYNFLGSLTNIAVDAADALGKKYAYDEKYRTLKQLSTLPHLANIIRPYRQQGFFLSQKRRLDDARRSRPIAN